MSREIVLRPIEEDKGTPPPAPTVVPASAGAPSAPDAGRFSLIFLAIAGILSALGLMLGVIDAGPLSTGILGLGLLLLLVALIVGAVGGRELPEGVRIAMGVGAVLVAFFLLYTWLVLATISASASTCGAIAAVPGMLAVRGFVMARERLARRFGAPPTPIVA